MENWIKTKRHLEAQIRNGRRSPTAPSHLKLEKIKLVENLFSESLLPESFVGPEALAEHIFMRYQDPSFDPLVVFWAGNEWILINGYLRYALCKTQNVEKPLSVVVFKGTLDEAIAKSVKSGIQTILPISASKKATTAWRLVVGTNLSSYAVMKLMLVTEAALIHMWRVRDELSKTCTIEELAEMDWQYASRVFQRLQQPNSFVPIEWSEAQAKCLANRITEQFGTTLGTYPDVVLRALEIYDPRIVDRFAMYLGVDPVLRKSERK